MGKGTIYKSVLNINACPVTVKGNHSRNLKAVMYFHEQNQQIVLFFFNKLLFFTQFIDYISCNPYFQSSAVLLKVCTVQRTG